MISPDSVLTPTIVLSVRPIWKDIAVRAGKTFIQGATGAVGGLFVLTEIVKPTGLDIAPLVVWATGAGIGGVSAVLSWVWNAAVAWANKP